MSVDTPLSHRIEGEAAESATGDFAPIIETMGEAHRCGRRPRRASNRRRRPDQGKNRRKMMEVRDSRDRNASIECGSPGACAQRSGTAMCVAGDIESISRDSTWRVRETHRETLSEAGSCFAQVMPIAEPLTYPEDRRARKDGPKRAIRESAVREECARGAGDSI